MKVGGQAAPPPERDSRSSVPREREREGWDRALASETQREVQREADTPGEVRRDTDAPDEVQRDTETKDDPSPGDREPTARGSDDGSEDTASSSTSERDPAFADGHPSATAEQDLAWLGLLGAAFVLPAPAQLLGTQPLATATAELPVVVAPGEGLADLAGETWGSTELVTLDAGPPEAPTSVAEAPISAPLLRDTTIASPPPPTVAARPTEATSSLDSPEAIAPPTTTDDAIELEVGELGKLRLHVEVADDGLKLEIQTDDPRTAAFLQARKTELLDAVQATSKGASIDVNVTAEEHHRRSGRDEREPRPDAPRERGPSEGAAGRLTPRHVGLPGLVNEVA